MKSTQLMFSVFSAVTLLALSLTDANAASIRVRCVKTASSSKVDVDARDVTPGQFYRARVKSGAKVRTSNLLQANANGEAEFDFSSKPKDQAAGATAIPANFIVGTPASVTGKIFDADGFVVATDIVNCVVK